MVPAMITAFAAEEVMSVGPVKFCVGPTVYFDVLASNSGKTQFSEDLLTLTLFVTGLYV